MNASVRMLLDAGIAEIAEHLQMLHVPVLEWAARSGVRVVSPVDHHGSGILCVMPGDVGGAFRSLKAGRVICGMREGAIRLSPHLYNTVAEMERVVDILEQA
jgi:selenocysteine lyase/cysteine desulfurase